MHKCSKFSRVMKRIRGFIDEFRISKNARWTSNFTAPTEKFGTKSITTSGSSSPTLLFHCDGSNGSSTFTSSSSSLSIADSKDFQFGQKDFTIDFWVKFPPLKNKWYHFFINRNNEQFNVFVDGQHYQPINEFLTRRFLRRE